jgi:hypothetical protein
MQILISMVRIRSTASLIIFYNWVQRHAAFGRDGALRRPPAFAHPLRVAMIAHRKVWGEVFLFSPKLFFRAVRRIWVQRHAALAFLAVKSFTAAMLQPCCNEAAARLQCISATN